MPTRARDAGMATVEAAIALSAIVTVVAMLLAGITAVLDQLRCTDAAREAARLLARGDPDRARQAVTDIAPAGARLDLQQQGDTITVDVTLDQVSPLLPGVHPHAHAVAISEPADP
jgi:Flp pilus assembly protein TadG